MQIQNVESQRPHPLDVAPIAVVFAPGRLVGTTEPDQIGADDAMPGGHHYRNHLAVQIRPRRLAMQHQNGIGAVRSVFHPGDLQRTALIV